MAKYTLLLQRDSEHKGVVKPNNSKVEDSTLGTMTLTDESGKVLFKGYTCENIGPSTDTPMQDKRIVARTYKIAWTDSSKNGALSKMFPKYKMANGRNKAIHVLNPEDPKFAGRRILIHVGNYPQDTEGCLLVGQTKNPSKGTVSSSTLAINELFEAIAKIDINEVDLVVKEI